MEQCVLAALSIVEVVGLKEEFYEDLLDVLDDWAHRKDDVRINPLADLFSSRGGGASPAGGARPFAPFGFGNVGMARAAAARDRRIPDVLKVLSWLVFLFV
jgi:hypothetical protein